LADAARSARSPSVSTDKSRAFRRDAAGNWQAEDADAPAAADSIDTGLKLLHNSAPQRVLEADELANRPLAEFGLAPPRLTVTARRDQGGSITIEFGVRQPARFGTLHPGRRPRRGAAPLVLRRRTLGAGCGGAVRRRQNADFEIARENTSKLVPATPRRSAFAVLG
jgi:hypothetical protein